MLRASVREKIEHWLSDSFDDETKNAIRKMSEAELNDAFGKDLSFGTAGMRGIVGPGTNRINIYTIQFATQGLANYILSQPTKVPKRVVIGYDSRLSSPEFAKETARVLLGNGIEAVLCKTCMPTPFVSFACREKNACAAVMITASHNPPKYNGYKVYWGDGAQVIEPHASNIVRHVEEITSPAKVTIGNLDDPRFIETDNTLIESYLKAIYSSQQCRDQNHAHGHALKVVYTPLHGTGGMLMDKALESWGFTNFKYVKSQQMPDGHFPTTKSPNPENPDSLQLGIEQLKQYKADLLLATDPDADRLGAVVMHQGTPHFLTGNEIAALCTEHILKKKALHDTLPSNGAIVKSIVTTDLLPAIANTYDIACIDVLTGFKYIGALIHEWEKTGEYTFIFGAEESHGYLIGTHSRDKDGIVAGCLVTELALDAKLENQTLIDRLEAVYQRYGYYRSKLINIACESGTEDMLAKMGELRADPPKDIAGIPVISIEDYQAGKSRNLQTGHLKKLSLPQANVLVFRLEGDIKIIIRPSGTEPKLKIYGLARHPTSAESADKTLTASLNHMKSLF
ncbi:MAG: phospho-sugar mutase [Chlamydiia bacterium]|nr:phospho-sugar mutase [Chlamydiia bacterium]